MSDLSLDTSFVELSDYKAQALTVSKTSTNKTTYSMLSSFFKKQISPARLFRKSIPVLGTVELVSDFITLSRELISHTFSLSRVTPKSSFNTKIDNLHSGSSFQVDFYNFGDMLNQNFAANRFELNNISSSLIDCFNTMNETNISNTVELTKSIDTMSELLRKNTEALAIIEKNRAQQDLLNVQIRNRQVSSSENSFSSLERKLDDLIDVMRRKELRSTSNPSRTEKIQTEVKLDTSSIVHSLDKISDRSKMLEALSKMNSNLSKLKNQEITVKQDNTNIVQSLEKISKSLDIKDLIKKVGGIATAFEALLEILKKDNCITKEALQELFAPQREFYTAENKLQEQRQKNLELDTKIKENETTARDFQDLDGNTIAKNKTPQEIRAERQAAELKWKTDKLNIELDQDFLDNNDLELPEFQSAIDYLSDKLKKG